MGQTSTADLCDAHPEVEVLEPGFVGFGGIDRFSGEAATVKVFEDNVRVRELLAEAGRGRVLVVDGGGSIRCAMLGEELARMAADNGWSGIVVYGCVRDVDALGRIALGIRAIGTHPRRSDAHGEGEIGATLRIGGVPVRSGDWIYADNDGIVIARRRLPERD